MFHTTTREFTSVGIDNDLSGPGNYCGAVVNDQTIYFIPRNADFIALYNVNTQSFDSVAIPSVEGTKKYSSGLIINRILYLTPCNADHVGIYHLDNQSFDMI